MGSLPPPHVVPASATHTHTVVFLHGRGDSAAKFSSSLRWSTDSSNRTLDQIFPTFRWVFPMTSDEAEAAFPQWFDIWNAQNFAEREELQAVGLRVSVQRIRDILADEAALLEGHWDRIVLAGISQGAATSVHTLLNLDIPGPIDGEVQKRRRLGAFLGFSCRMPFPGRSLAATRKVLDLEGSPSDASILENTPVLLEHCVNDHVVLVENGRVLRDTLRGFGAQVTWKEYPDGEHWFNSPTGIDDAVEFLKHVLELPEVA
ncbi:hypothetical protein BHE90_010541 [Fusarium euwallaceae]|uniref:Phospholipase/carboxylesterase/thioesterase domain-containing protein n=1 Tax=Fusarium euwallaceae TaxID=1147111 RepID=A0A430LH21_9HYPO|nr:hypothetical protein BHE90_010541 [Fusarium euwallaceae]